MFLKIFNLVDAQIFSIQMFKIIFSVERKQTEKVYLGSFKFSPNAVWTVCTITISKARPNIYNVVFIYQKMVNGSVKQLCVMSLFLTGKEHLRKCFTYIWLFVLREFISHNQHILYIDSSFSHKRCKPLLRYSIFSQMMIFVNEIK